MKKRILFVIPSLRSGGAEKSLITLLTLFDYEKYDVDLLCFRKDGLFFDMIPEKVNVLGGTENYEVFDGNAKSAIKYFVKKFKFISAFDRYRYTKIIYGDYNYEAEEKLWNLLKKQLPKIRSEYDIAVGYLEGNASRFAVDCVRAKRKIVYVHNDIKKLGIHKQICSDVFKKADKVVTVSDECLDSLKDDYAEFSEKFTIIENITSPTILGKESVKENVYGEKDCDTVLLTVGRCSPQKNIELAVQTCEKLVSDGKKIRWYHIGKGPLFDSVKKLVAEKGLDDKFIMLGEKANPYPYIGQCDIYVQTSNFEGKSIAIDEAKCLFRPIVVTDFSTVRDQIDNNRTGLIAQMTAESLAEKIGELISSPEKRNELSENLKNENQGNENEIAKFYEIL